MQQDDHLRTIIMVRRDLGGLDDQPAPPPFAIRTYQHGDEAAWTRIERLSDRYTEVTASLFEREFGHDEEDLRRRQLFLCDGDGRAIGTATAWHNSHYPAHPYGRVHWVAIVPSMQGRGLAKPLLSACLARMKALGCRGAYLTTNPPRVPAINLYLRFGFAPDVRSQAQRDAWGVILDQVKGEFRRIVAAELERGQ